MRKTELLTSYRQQTPAGSVINGEDLSRFTPAEEKIVKLISQGYHYATLKDALGTNSETLLHLLGNIIRKRSGRLPEEQS